MTEQEHTKQIEVSANSVVTVNLKSVMMVINNIEWALNQGAFTGLQLQELAGVVNNVIALKVEVESGAIALFSDPTKDIGTSVS